MLHFIFILDACSIFIFANFSGQKEGSTMLSNEENLQIQATTANTISKSRSCHFCPSPDLSDLQVVKSSSRLHPSINAFQQLQPNFSTITNSNNANILQQFSPPPNST